MNFVNIFVFLAMIASYKLASDFDSQGRSHLATATYWIYILCMHNRLCQIFGFFGFDECGISTQILEQKSHLTQTVHISVVIWIASFLSGMHF